MVEKKVESVFRPATGVTKRLKVAVYGAAGVGKTQFALTWPKAAVIDFEHGSDFYSHRARFDVFHTRSAHDAFQAMLGLEAAGKYETLVVDPVTMFWEALQEGYRAELRQRGRDREIVFGDWVKIKRPLKTAMALWTNLPLHVVLVGREAEVYEEKAGELTTTGVRMAAEKTVPHFADVVMRMFVRGGKHLGEIEKDRSGHFPTGSVIESPTFAHFAPILELSSSGEAVKIQADEEAASTDAALYAPDEREQAATLLAKARQIALKLGKTKKDMPAIMERLHLSEASLLTIDGATALLEGLMEEASAEGKEVEI